MQRSAALYFTSLLFPWCAAQELVGTAPTNRTALLEEFTAVGCGNCPAAHGVANALATAYPHQLVVVGVHGGSLATPTGAQPDFRTADGAALWEELDVDFQPQGVVNRGALAGAAQWAAAVADVVQQPSPVNVGAATTFQAATRALTIDVELYYTADRTADDLISVALVQDHIIGYQQDYANGAHTAYDHRHVLRDHVTPLQGDAVAEAEQGTLVQRTYTFTVPVEWEILDLSVVVFVREEAGVVWQVRTVPANGGATGVYNEARETLGVAFPVPADVVLFIPFVEQATERVLQLRDVQGRLVKEQRVPVATTLVGLDVADLAPGLYTYSCAGGPGRTVVVQ